jgi:hypothetical protein
MPIATLGTDIRQARRRHQEMDEGAERAARPLACINGLAAPITNAEGGDTLRMRAF